MKIGPLIIAVAVAAFAAFRWKRLGRFERGAGLLVVAALTVYATGVVQLPNVKHLIEDIGNVLGPYTYVFVGALAFLETGAFVGLVAPGETAIIIGGVVAGQGEINIVGLIALVWACAVAGDVTSFLLGRRLGRGFMERHGPKVKITPERLTQVEGFFDRHGGKAVLIGRFIGLVRAVAPFIAGASKMPLRRFLPYDIVGAGLWGTTFCLLGYIFWRSFDRVAEYASKGAFVLGTIIVLVVGAVLIYRRLKDPEQRARLRAWGGRQADKPVIRPLVRVLSPIWTRVLGPVWRRAVGPLRFGVERITPGNLGLELTTLVAVAAVGGFVFAALSNYLRTHAMTDSDRWANDILERITIDVVVDIAKVVTHLGDLGVVAAVTAAAGAVLVARHHRLEAVVLVIGLVLVVLVANGVADAQDRARPLGALVETSGAAYPSRHAAYSVAWVGIAVALARALPLLAGFTIVTVSVVLAAGIGLSRVYLRAHHMSDVLGGWGLAAAIFAVLGIVALLVAHIRQNRHHSP